MRFARRKFLQVGVIAIAITLFMLSDDGAWSQVTRTIKIVVPVSPGGVLDTLARLLGEQIRHAQGVTMLVENRSGAGGMIAAEAVSLAAPDGNTLMMISPNLLATSQLRKLDYDLRLEPVCYLVSVPVAEQERGKNFVVIGYDTPDRYDRPAMMGVRRTKVAIFGEQGRFGAALQQRLAQRVGAGQIKATFGEEQNREIATNSDIIVVAIQPHRVGALLNEISSSLTCDAQIVSFTAGYPLELVYRLTRRPAARAIADPWWNVSAIMQGAGFSDDHFRRIFDGLTKKQTIMLKTDKDIDEFTAAINHAFVVLLGQRLSVIRNADEHLEFIAPRIGLSRVEINKFLPKREPSELISSATSKGGICDAIMQTIQEEPDITPSDLFNRCFEIAPGPTSVVRWRTPRQ
jgi:hypothetical protein